MRQFLKRIVTLWLVVTLVVSNCVSVFADALVSSDTPGYVHIPSPGSGSTKLANVFADYGFRVTITDSTQIQGVITTLQGGYTKDDLAAQRAQVVEACKHMYIDPGKYGLYFYKGDYRKGDYGVSSSYAEQGWDIRSSRIKMVEATVTEDDNELAGMCYAGIEGAPRTVPTACVPTMAEIVANADSNYATGGDYLYHLKTLFKEAKGISSDSDMNSYIIGKMRSVISTGAGTDWNLRRFVWDTDLYKNTGVEVTASDMVQWARIGYLTTLIQFAWLAQAVGDDATYQEFETKIWNWVQAKYALSAMPLLEIEACQVVGINGSTDADSNRMYITLPYTMATNYGRDVAEWLFAGGWTGNLKDALATYLGTRSPVSGGQIGQGFGGYFKNGVFSIATSSYKDRKYLTLLRPSDDREASFGYAIGFTYAADTPDTVPTNPNGAAVPGSFTWKLTPSGVIDETPDTEVNETSTVYEINMSQNGANSNNYDKWKTYVQQYGGNNNQLRITVYRTSEDLSADDKAKKYTREQVMQQGKNATTGFDRVIVGSAKITGIPGVGEVKSGGYYTRVGIF